MRIVAIRASHEAFIHAVFEGHGELRSYIGVAGVAEFRLSFCQQCFWRRCLVDRMAGCADNVGRGVRRSLDVGAAQRLAMASEAGVQNFLRLQHRERLDRRLAAASLNMFLPGPVAGFAALCRRRQLCVHETLAMRILEERGGYVRMTRSADLASDESAWLDRVRWNQRLQSRWRCGLTEQESWTERQENKPQTVERPRDHIPTITTHLCFRTLVL